jgi:hypothetical protein
MPSFWVDIYFLQGLAAPLVAERPPDFTPSRQRTVCSMNRRGSWYRLTRSEAKKQEEKEKAIYVWH